MQKNEIITFSCKISLLEARKVQAIDLKVSHQDIFEFHTIHVLKKRLEACNCMIHGIVDELPLDNYTEIHYLIESKSDGKLKIVKGSEIFIIIDVVPKAHIKHLKYVEQLKIK